MDEKSETFMVYVVVLEAKVLICPSKTAQMATPLWDKDPTKILTKYSHYADIFSTDLRTELPEKIGINKYIIELIEGQQLLYKPIYALTW